MTESESVALPLGDIPMSYVIVTDEYEVYMTLIKKASTFFKKCAILTNIMNKQIFSTIKAFIKKETVFSAALLLALISFCFVKPNRDVLTYPDYRVLSLLFCLMFIVAGVREQWIFRRLAEKLTKHVHEARMLELILVLLCFFSSMLITNDVALITFVPFALALMKGAGLSHRIIRVVVLQTIAANLGSMLTPIGNPQNLYLYSRSGVSMGTFLLWMLPLTLISLILLIVLILVGHKEDIHVSFEKADMPICRWKLTLLCILFLLCMGTVTRLLPWQVSFLVVLIVGLFCFRNLFREVDYFLLGTFIGFFVFIGNMQRIPALNSLLQELLEGRELPVAFLASQVISNVPAAMLLSGFTNQYRALLYGVDIGGLGTLIASLASLISYKFYAVTPGSKKGSYLALFTAYNILFIVVLLGWCMMF